MRVLVATAVLCATVVSGAPELVQVQVMHRHGARYAITPVNASQVCTAARLCGQLNSEGKAMLVNLGKDLRQRCATFNLPEGYNQFDSYTRSTDLDRTVQSADGFLRGLYPNITDFYPVVNTYNFATDTLLHVDAQMSYHIPAEINKAPGFSLPSDYYTRLSLEDIQTIGRELDVEGLCTMPAGYSQLDYRTCVLRCQDIAASWNAEGRLSTSKTPMVVEKYDVLAWYRRTWNTGHYVFDKSNADQRQRGSLGYNLASTIVGFMNQEAGVEGSKPEERVFEWSAHDTTYMPLASAIGYNTAEYMLPLFGQTFIFELWRDTSLQATADAGQYYVRIFGGAPTQTPGAHEYNITELEVHGLDAGGAAVTSEVGKTHVSLADFARGVGATAPESSRGDCYLSSKVLKAIDCDGTAAAESALCKKYRQNCPSRSCPGGYVLNPGDLSCTATENHQLISVGTAFAMIFASVAGGILLGGAGSQLAARCCCQKKIGDYDTVNVE